MNEKPPVHFNCPKRLLEEFDDTWEKTGKFRDRTHALTTSMNDFINKYKEEPPKNG